MLHDSLKAPEMTITNSSRLFFSLMTLAAVLLFSLATFLTLHQMRRGSAVNSKKVVQVIVDTDIGPWTDDVGSMAVLHSWADAGRLKILGIVSNNAYPGAAPVIDALNSYFHRPQIPIGITKNEDAYANAGILGWPEWLLANSDKYPHLNVQNNSQAEDAVQLYRRILAKSSSKNGGITILSIGYLTNLAALLASPPDHLSPLNGTELVRSKVKRLVAMAGRFPSGLETNLKNQTAAAQQALHHWPTPVTFVGFEVGTAIRCGSNLLHPENGTSVEKDSPVSKIFEMYVQHRGRLDGCFDQVAAYILVAGLEPFYETVKGRIEIAANGSNQWVGDDELQEAGLLGQQVYIRQKAGVSSDTITKAIDELMER